MSKKKKNADHSDNLKIGDVVLLYYSTKTRTDDGRKSGFIMADLSGYYFA